MPCDDLDSVVSPAQSAQNDPNDHRCLIMIFGASGDLTARKLVPALYSLQQEGKIGKHVAVMGISRTKMTDDEFRDRVHQFKPDAYDDASWKAFRDQIHYQPADATQAGDWKTIKQRAEELGKLHACENRYLFYLSVSPEFFEPIILNIGHAQMVTEGRRWCSLGDDTPWQRIIVEKPFGHDPESAESLNRTLENVFDESSIYRIDHYLGKELVQNMLVLRFANSIFEPIWNQNYIDHVQITASETVGVEGRASYYDSPAGGAMRDMVQSHLLQVLSLVAMEPPVSLDATDIRTEKIKAFKALRVPKMENVPKLAIRGQYGPGTVKGKPLAGYREQEGVAADSQTDTFAMMTFHIDTWRWGGTPFYLRSGKAMKAKKTEIVLYLKPTPHCLFREQACNLKPNQIVINVQPNEGIRLRFEGKVPGSGMNIGDVVMDFDYKKQWDVEPPDGYATLLMDCIRGDQTLFKHRDEIQSSWNAVQPVLDYWANHPDPELPNYAVGTWGPDASEKMLRDAGRYWRND